MEEEIKTWEELLQELENNINSLKIEDYIIPSAID